MNYFRHQKLNYLVVLFQLYLNDKRFQLELFREIMGLDLAELCEENEQIGSLFTFLCHEPFINQHPHFESGFIYLLNTINFRLMSLNARPQAASILLAQNQAEKPMILLEMLRLKYFSAADQIFKFLRFATAESMILKDKIHLAFYQTNDCGQLYINEITQFMRHDEIKRVASVLIHAKTAFNVHQLFIEDWMFSILNIPVSNSYEIFLNERVHHEKRQCFLSIFLLMLDYEIFHKSSWRVFYDCEDDLFSLLDKIIVRDDLDDVVLSEYLYFMKQLLNNQHISYEQFAKVIFFHTREGYSPLHEILFLGKIGRLKHYLNFINVLFEKGCLDIFDIRKALMKTNAQGYTALYQAINNFSADIPSLFLEFYMKFFSKAEVSSVLNRGFLNEQTGRRVRYYCGHDKAHWAQTNATVNRIRYQIGREPHIDVKSSVDTKQAPGFFSPISLKRGFSPIKVQGPR